MRLLRTFATLLCAAGATTFLAAPAAAGPPPIKHVWVIVLENENAAETFGGDKAPYLARTLTAQGQFLPNYYATGHLSLDNYISMVSGQAPNPQTQADCLFYTDFAFAGFAADGQAIGSGCVYPSQVKTIANQLQDSGRTWKGYMEDMEKTQPHTCRHPVIGQQDHTQSAEPGDQYAARHNPFIYFHSIIDTPSCDANDVPLERMPADLQSAATTANYNFITPNLCHDGHDEPCVTGEPGGLVSADAFLRKWIPIITESPAYKEGGMVIVTFDEAESGDDASACCGELPGPNTPNPGGPTVGPGGGRVGMVVLSPWVSPGTVNKTAYNHYSLLRNTQDLFGLGPLGYSGQAGLPVFGSDVYNGPGPVATPAAAATGCGSQPLPAPTAGRLPYGSLMKTVHILRRGRYRPFLRLILDKPAATGILDFPPRRIHPGRQAPIRRLPLTRVAGCRAYHLLLPYVHGTVVLRASPGTGLEGRSFHY